MTQALQNQNIAILVTDGFEQVELTEPRKALEQAGAAVRVVSPAKGKVKGWNHTEWGHEIPVDDPLDQADPDRYDALVLPGGVMNPDKLRRNDRALAFVKAFFTAQKPVAVICHGPWTLIDAGVVRGRRITSYPSLQTDLRNAGADWVDQEMIVDRGLISSRKPDDLPAFNRAMVEEFAKASRRKSTAA
ncbi:MAG TPA: type 1 glutamine amidotransferase domain-containing protein [Nitrospiraceae bacterium]|nr:type 1 glutamine amidotransferase domain-containing protein [Nitrospiraceae bacterium]